MMNTVNGKDYPAPSVELIAASLAGVIALSGDIDLPIDDFEEGQDS